MQRKKGIIHIGFGVLLLILIVVYVLISLSNSGLADGINEALRNLFGTLH